MESLETIRANYTKELIAKDKREDGRGMFDFREIKIKKGTMGNAEGSAQVDLGTTRVLAGVKIGLDTPFPDTQDQGNMSMAAELLPLASAKYETGPPSPDAIELSRVTDRGIRAGECIDLKKLFIEEDKVWGVYVDVYVLNYGGNLFDACEIAAMSALHDAHMPTYDDGKVLREDKSKKLEIGNTVSSCTFAKIDGKLLLDPTPDEESAADARLTITTDGKSIRSMQKGLGGSFSKQEIEQLSDVAFNKHKELKSLIESA